MLWFAPQSFISSKICRMVMCPVRVTENHVMVFFVQKRKTMFKLENRATFAIAKSKNIHFQSDGDMYNQRYMLPRV